MARRLPQVLGQLEIAGGAASDALVALAAMGHGAELVTRGARVWSTYIGPVLPKLSPASRQKGRLRGEAVDDPVAALLGVGESDVGVDLEGLATGVAAVGLDGGVVDALGLEPGEEEVT